MNYKSEFNTGFMKKRIITSILIPMSSSKVWFIIKEHSLLNTTGVCLSVAAASCFRLGVRHIKCVLFNTWHGWNTEYDIIC